MQARWFGKARSLAVVCSLLKKIVPFFIIAWLVSGPPMAATAASPIYLPLVLKGGTTTDNIPPPPETIAPMLDPSAASDIAEDVAFLYSGNSPIQTGVAPNTIDPQRLAVLRGRVLNNTGMPVPGVTITIHNHPEYGQTRSRADGMFDMVVNGGSVLTINYAHEGMLPVQRKLKAPWRDYVWLPDVVLLPPDSQVTSLTLSESTPLQVARGSTVTDIDGQRQATLIIPGGTQAEMVLQTSLAAHEYGPPHRYTQALDNVSIRATEYTVGDSGASAMPGELPPQSGYTYALEYSVDEALDAGAIEVRFSQPLYHYVENFLDFPVGMAVPTGSYDRDAAAWKPSENGHVVQIVAIADGMAHLDTTGDGVADNNSALNITDAERRQLATLYAPGQTLWRVPISHFTPWDCNWPFGPPFGAFGPFLGPLFGSGPDNPCAATGSIIECDNQVLGEEIALAGIPFSLNYRSSRVPGRAAARELEVPLTDANVPEGLTQIELEITIAGQRITESFDVQPNRSYTFTWDGLDAYGRAVPREQALQVRVGYVYDAVYQDPGTRDQAFGQFSGVAIEGNPTRQEVTIWQEWEGTIGTFDATTQGLGGWTLSVHHSYNPDTNTLYMGDGSRRSAEGAVTVITNVAGNRAINFQGDYNGDNIPATSATLADPHGLAVGEDGSSYIADTNNNRVRRVAPDGTITTFAGTGELPSGEEVGDGNAATQAMLAAPKDVALGPDGSLYIADTFNNRVRRVAADGTITTVAGGTFLFDGSVGDGGPATDAMLYLPSGIAVASDGSIYIADAGNNRVQLVAPDGTITTVAGTGEEGFAGDGGPAVLARVWQPSDVTLGADGTIYIADTFNDRVRQIGIDGTISTVAGSDSTAFFAGDGGPATLAALNLPEAVAVGNGGVIYIADTGNNRVRQVRADGTITTMAGRDWGIADADVDMGNHRPAVEGLLWQPAGLATAPDGSLYIGDTMNQLVRRVALQPAFTVQKDTSLVLVANGPQQTMSADMHIVASWDGSEVYLFDSVGRHQRTLNAYTGATLYEFGYDSDNRLTSITDGDGNVTTTERDSSGAATAIVGPYGARTTLSLNDAGYLASVTSPASHTTHLEYASGGLLTSFTDPNSNVSRFGYDKQGRLVRDENAAGGVQTLERIEHPSGVTVEKNTAAGYTTRSTLEYGTDDERERTTTWPDNSQSHEIARSSWVTVTHAEGIVTTQHAGPDPRWGMWSPLVETARLETPGGLVATASTERDIALTERDDPFALLAITETLTLNGQTFTSAYHAPSRTFVNTTPAGREMITAVDSIGRMTRIQIGDLAENTLSYDEHGRISTMRQGSGSETRTVSFAYNNAGYLAAITNQLSDSAQFAYDADGRLVQQTMPDGRAVQYTYDPNGNLTSITPPGGDAHVFDYSALDQPTHYTPPEVDSTSMPTTYTYNTEGQITRIERPDGRAVAVDYTSDGNISTVGLARGSVRYTYDALTGQLTTAEAPDQVTLDYSYDGLLTTGEHWSGPIAGRVDYTYDNNQRIATLTIADGQTSADPIALEYDPDGLLIQAGDLELDYSWYSSLLDNMYLADVYESFEYNQFGEVTRRSVADSSTSFYNLEYTRDAIGRIISQVEAITDTTHTYDYRYDSRGWLTEVVRNGTPIASYTYDANGNRLSATIEGATIQATYDEQDRLIQYGDTGYSYTDAGDLASKTTDSQTTSYQYDELGNLMTVTLPGGTRIDYVVDSENRRIGKRVNGTLMQGFLYMGNLHPVAELDSSGAIVSRFVYASRTNVPDYIIRGGVAYRIIADHVGSPRLVVDTTTGTIVQHIAYDAFGNVVTDSNPGFQPFGFAGGIYDRDTGLVRFGARDYDPTTGRWTAKDPILFEGGDFNLYGYALQDPVNFIDPDGRFRIQGEIAFGIGIKFGLNITSRGFSVQLGVLFGTAAGIKIEPFTKLESCSELYVEAKAKASAGVFGVEGSLKLGTSSGFGSKFLGAAGKGPYSVNWGAKAGINTRGKASFDPVFTSGRKVLDIGGKSAVEVGGIAVFRW